MFYSLTAKKHTIYNVPYTLVYYLKIVLFLLYNLTYDTIDT